MEYMLSVAQRLGTPLTHFAVKADGISGKSIRSINDHEKTLARLKDKRVTWLTGYSLPDGFETAAFDYLLHCSRSEQSLSIAIRQPHSTDVARHLDAWLAT
jgi:hypothetical protein